MANRLVIDDSTVFDNPDERQVEFSGEIDGDDYEFAVQYDVLEALSGDVPSGDAALIFQRFADPICDAALAALGRGSGTPPIVVSENDLA